MENIRKPFQGILNIINFNWHLYVLAFAFIFLMLLTSNYTNLTFSIVLKTASLLTLITIIISLSVSYYIYDVSTLYKFDWIKKDDNKISIININAGFDETSELLINKFKHADFLALDFYDSRKHTEVSIKRARKRYPPYPNTLTIETVKIKLESNTIDKIFVIMSAHEIRNNNERIIFFSELNRLLKPKGQIFVVEHLRDFSNFIAYTIGVFHFYSKPSWLNTFSKSELTLTSEIKNTPFISTFTLEKNGNTL